MITKVETAIRIYKQEGAEQLLLKTVNQFKFSLTTILANIETRDSIIDSKSERLLCQSQSTKSIEYSGENSDVPQLLSKCMGEIEISDKYCRQLSNVNVVGPDVIVATDDNLIIPETVGWSRKNHVYKEYIVKRHGLIETLRLSRNEPTYELENGFILNGTCRGSSNFGMWFYTVLPKLWWYDKISDCKSNMKIITPELKQFQRDSLEYIGYDLDEIYEVSDQTLQCDSLILPPQTGWSRNGPWETPKEMHKWTRKKLLANIEAGDFSNRVYISRKDADFRFVSNEGEVMSLLQKYGFQKYVLTDFSLKDQMKIFAGADFVIGPHGAGMAHMIHSDTCDWVELFPGKKGIMPYYFILADHLDLNYEFLICDHGKNKKEDSNHPRHRNLIVDTDKLESIVQPKTSCDN